MCNTALPTNAVNVTDVRVGMHIRAAYSGEQGVVKQASTMGTRRFFIFENGTNIVAANHGTFRLVDPPVGYNYHAGHGCLHDGNDW